MTKKLSVDAPEKPPFFYPTRMISQREMDYVLANCATMCADYDRHYAVLLDYMKTYLKTKDKIGDYPVGHRYGPSDPLSLQELETRITVAIGAGFYILSPEVALYFMAIDPVLYIDQAYTLLTDESHRWGPVCVIASLLTALLACFAGELAGVDNQKNLKALVKDLPIEISEYTNQLTVNASAILTYRVGQRTLH